MLVIFSQNLTIIETINSFFTWLIKYEITPYFKYISQHHSLACIISLTLITGHNWLAKWYLYSYKVYLYTYNITYSSFNKTYHNLLILITYFVPEYDIIASVFLVILFLTVTDIHQGTFKLTIPVPSWPLPGKVFCYQGHWRCFNVILYFPW